VSKKEGTRAPWLKDGGLRTRTHPSIEKNHNVSQLKGAESP
jgi:hypothetical protein